MSVPAIVREVKQCFILSDKAKSLANQDSAAFQKGLEPLKDQVQKMTDAQLDAFLASRSRHFHYDRLTWTWRSIRMDEAGVWFAAGGLPSGICLGSVKETASLIAKMGGPAKLATPYSDHRAKDNLLGIVRVSSVISKERLLSVIGEVGGTHRGPPCKRMQWDLCDGSLRAVGQALSGLDTVNAFLGT